MKAEERLLAEQALATLKLVAPEKLEAEITDDVLLMRYAEKVGRYQKAVEFATKDLEKLLSND